MPTKVEIRGHIAEIVLGYAPVNALDANAWLELAQIIENTGRNKAVRCILIYAETKGFCAGVDLKELQAHPERIVDVNRGNYLTFRAVRSCEVPVVVAAHGFIIGGGIGICGASDILFASEDAYFSLPEIDRGSMGGASHLARLLPLHKVRALYFTGGKCSAAEAYRLGAIEKVVLRADLLNEARAFCEIIATKSRRALVLAKEALNGIEATDVDRSYRFEQGFTLEMYMDPDSQTSRDAFVATKDVARF